MIEFSESEGGFQLAFKGVLILDHRLDAPCLEIGIGQGRFRSRHGSFSIRDALRTRESLALHRVLSAGSQQVEIAFGERLRLQAKVVDGRLELRPNSLAPEWNRLWLHLVGTPSEHIYGCGEQYSRLDLKGSRVPLWVEEQGIGRGSDLITFLADLFGGAGGDWYTTYFPQPTFVSSRNLFCHVDNPGYAVFDFSRPDRSSLALWGIPDRIVLGVEPDPASLLGSLSALLGRQPRLPDWAFDGLWLAVQGGSDAVRAKTEAARRAGIKVGAIWAQDWVGERPTLFGRNLNWNWQVDSGRYPDLPGLIQELDAQAIRFLGYVNCFLAPGGRLYQEARDQGFLVKDRRGEAYQVKVINFPVGILDLTHPGARTWMKGIIRSNLLDVGMAGWMADFGEHLPVDAVLASGESAEDFHNQYPVAWAQLNHEALAEAGALDRALFFTRAGHAGSSSFTPLVWAGDQNTNWSRDDGLPTVIPAGLSLGLSGIGAFHSDLGGYTTVAWMRRSKELFLRWAELAAFSPIMRTHEGLRPGANWQFDSDSETLKHLAGMTRIHAALADYLRGAAEEYQRTGLPILRHPYIHYAGDEVLHQKPYQYLLGRDLLIAPVTAPGRDTWDAVLPDDRWIHLWSGRSYGPGPVTVPARIGEPPVFFREASQHAAFFEDLPRSNR